VRLYGRTGRTADVPCAPPAACPQPVDKFVEKYPKRIENMGLRVARLLRKLPIVAVKPFKINLL
jgi:hypothetical protein